MAIPLRKSVAQQSILKRLPPLISPDPPDMGSVV
jgi:hypothetical protein